MGTAVGAIDVAISRVTAIANSVLPSAESEVTTASTSFRNLTLPPASFSEVPLAQQLGEQHQAAHQVFRDTVEGVIDDLVEFRQKLLDSMKSHENNDDAVHAALASLGRRYDGHVYHSQENYERARQEQGDRLGRPTHPAPTAAADPAPAPLDGGPAADPTTGPAPVRSGF
jgi:hypothetical protein